MSRPTVVLLHGLARTERSLAGLRRDLERRGFATWSCTYPSRQHGIEALAEHVAERIEADLGDRPLAAVTHSLGGIILRHLADRFDWQRAVMLAPPNGGSAAAARLRDWSAYRAFYGPAGAEVADGDWPPPPRPCGVVAGTAGVTPSNPSSWLLRLFGALPEAPHDGTVSVAEAGAVECDELVCVDASHTWIMNRAGTRRLIARFLEAGTFAERGK